MGGKEFSSFHLILRVAMGDNFPFLITKRQTGVLRGVPPLVPQKVYVLADVHTSEAISVILYRLVLLDVSCTYRG
jgi:hypothetical protein